MFDLFHKRIVKNIILFLMTLSLNSCIYLVVGSVGAVGGYIVSPDTVEGVVAGHSSAEVWDAAEEVIGIKGIILEKNQAAGLITAKVHGTKVTITVLKMSATAVKLVVKARKAFFPNISMAQDIYIKIDKYLDDEDPES